MLCGRWYFNADGVAGAQQCAGTCGAPIHLSEAGLDNFLNGRPAVVGQAVFQIEVQSFLQIMANMKSGFRQTRHRGVSILHIDSWRIAILCLNIMCVEIRRIEIRRFILRSGGG